MNVPIQIIYGFQQRGAQDSQNLKNDTFCRLPNTSAQCFIGTVKYPVAGVVLNFEDDDYSQGCGQIKEAFRALTKNDFLQLHISDHDLRTLTVNADDVGYLSCVFYL